MSVKFPISIKVPITDFTISDIADILKEPLSGITVEDLFNSPNLDGSCIDNYYCPPVGPFASDVDGKLYNLQSLPYDIGKFRKYGYRVIQHENFAKLQTIQYFHQISPHIDLQNALFDGFPSWDFADCRYGSHTIYGGNDLTHEKILVIVPANRILNITYNLRPFINFNIAEYPSLIITNSNGDVLLNKTLTSTTKYNGSDISTYSVVTRITNQPFGDIWDYADDIYVGGLYQADYEQSDEFAFHYHNTTNTNAFLFITGHNYINKTVNNNNNFNIFLRFIINEDVYGNAYNFYNGTNYSYSRSNTFLYPTLNPSTQYTLRMEGGNSLNSGNTNNYGLSFKIGYHIGGIHQGYLNLTNVNTGVSSVQWNHPANILANYTFNTPANMDGIYLHVAASRRQTKYTTTNCAYKFMIY